MKLHDYLVIKWNVFKLTSKVCFAESEHLFKRGIVTLSVTELEKILFFS
jgi:hypothetical protein